MVGKQRYNHLVCGLPMSSGSQELKEVNNYGRHPALHILVIWVVYTKYLKMPSFVQNFIEICT